MQSLVDDITYTASTKSTSGLTESAILGPFWREDHPIRENWTTISFDTPSDAEPALLYGKVTDAKTGKPVANASVDIWQASTNGLYEQQDPNQQDLNLRGKFITDAEGNYAIRCLRPTPYPVSQGDLVY
jgi:catechol 1,2-dioxygenase